MENIHTSPPFKQWSILELEVCSYWLNIGLGQLNTGLIMH